MSSEDRRTYVPSKREVVSAVESLERPSTPESVADSIDAMRRAQGRWSAKRLVREPYTSVDVVRALLRELDESAEVKGCALRFWADMDVVVDQTVFGFGYDGGYSGKLWWSVERTRKAVADIERRLEKERTEEKRHRAVDGIGGAGGVGGSGGGRSGRPASHDSALRSAVDRVLEEQRKYGMRGPYQSRNPFEGPQGP